MNTYKKFCPNVFIAKCEEEYKKGDTIIVETRRGKENECIVHNFIGYTGTKENPLYCYSITRADGFNCQERAKKKAEKLNGYADNAKVRSDNWREKSNEGKDFLVLGEPIKVGHHSEKRHRALIERNWNRMSNSMNELDKSKAYEERAKYWESLTNVINLSMPESLEFFKIQLEEATEYHKGLKDGTIQRTHSYSLTYAKKKVNELKKKYEIAVKLWA
eukprot:TRINITY_DN8216_c0_g1_i5.p1 TRINITY_DN8216_c0_g1~~TRINITY_DN8216_c0_g1_i5.p1  ORF type:complete len:218 (-),score=25.55 TRINITY_DN8216_c0_g1_i5:126-779(-)